MGATEEEFARAVESASVQNASGSDLRHLLVRKGLGDDMEKALRGLSEEFRAALLLVDVNELSYEEAAQTMEVATGTVRSRLSRARAMMRYALAHVVRIRRSASS